MVAHHCAKYSDAFLPILANILKGCKRVLDFNAGVCKIVRIRDYGFAGQIICIEIEAPWAEGGRDEECLTLVCNAEHMPLLDGYCDGAAVSVTYGNRLSDHHNAKDGSRRHGYKFGLGRDLTTGNTGEMSFTGKRKASLRYCTSYKRQYMELYRVLAAGKLLVLNISDHIRKQRIRKGKTRKQMRVHTTLWHRLCLQSLGFELVEEIKIETPRLRYGANAKARVPYESILVFKRGE